MRKKSIKKIAADRRHDTSPRARFWIDFGLKIGARGVSNILPLGQVGYTYPGMPHDGMMVLSEMVDWKTA